MRLVTPLLFVAALLALQVSEPRAAADPTKVLRISSSDIASLDPEQGTDLFSTRVATEIFEALYKFDYLAEPAKVVTNTAEAMPVITDGGRRGRSSSSEEYSSPMHQSSRASRESWLRRITPTRSSARSIPIS